MVVAGAGDRRRRMSRETEEKREVRREEVERYLFPIYSLVSNTTGHNRPFQIVLLYDSLSPISTRSSVRAVQIGLVPAWAGGISMSGQQD